MCADKTNVLIEQPGIN